MIDEGAVLTWEHYLDAQRYAYLLLDRLDPSLQYHCKEHTTQIVVPAAMEIAEAEGFSLEERVLLGIAAAFHDTGFLDRYVKNEPAGAAYARRYMEESAYGFSEAHIRTVENAILKTDIYLGLAPSNRIESALLDADMAVLADEKFPEWSWKLRSESVAHPDCPLYGSAAMLPIWTGKQFRFIGTYSWRTAGAAILYSGRQASNRKQFLVDYTVNVGFFPI